MSDTNLWPGLILVLICAALGGFLAKKLKVQPIVGYIVLGVILGFFLPSSANFSQLSQVGIILLLFSLGIELSFSRLIKVFKVAVIGGLTQIIAFSAIGYFFFSQLGFNPATSIIFALAFSLSSTAVVVKTLADRGETETVHGIIMTGWLLVQDLAVIPIVVLISSLGGGGSSWLGTSLISLFKASWVILVAVILGRRIIPFIFHKIAAVNSREILVIAALGFSGAIAYLTYLLGITPSLGAFIAGLVISESAENHAIFAETRPFRDLFVALFFVSLGFMIKPAVILANFGVIIGIFFFTLFVKTVVDFCVSQMLGYRGKVAVAIALGLSQVGEFSFVIFSQGLALGILSPEKVSIGTAVVLLTLIFTPFLFKSIVPVWKILKEKTVNLPWLNKYFVGGDKKPAGGLEFTNHIIICGYGRVGGWVGKALEDLNTPFVIVDYNQNVVTDLKKQGFPVIFGDPGEVEVLEAANIRAAKAVILAIPDKVSQETLIGYVQTVAPEVKIISRVHLDEDWERLKVLGIHKIVQPEFEAAMAITKTILISMGKSREEIDSRLKKLRISRSLK